VPHLLMVSLGRTKRPAASIRLFTTVTITICNCFDAPQQWLPDAVNQIRVAAFSSLSLAA